MNSEQRFLIALKQEAHVGQNLSSSSASWRERALLAVMDSAFARIKNLEEQIHKIESHGIDE